MNLLLLDLSHTGLKVNLLRELTSTLRKAKSLLCVDLTGNPGVTDKNRKFLSERIRCKPDPYDKVRVSYITDFIADLNKK